MKPTLEKDVVTALLVEVLGVVPSSVEPLVEGLESQAFRFRVHEEAFVVRINPSLRGFEKDLWAYSTVGGRVPVPRVVSLGSVDSDHAYCISEWVPGVTLEDLTAAGVEAVVGEVASVWRAIAETDVSSIDGFGDFSSDGSAAARTWHEVLRTTLEYARGELTGTLPNHLQEPHAVIAAYEQLIDRCPEERHLIHGDFGANNMLAKRGRITAVLDWDLAKVGDALYDVANCYFWASSLTCMEAQASYFQRTLSHLPAYDERISCYAFRIGLEEVRENVRNGDLRMAAWALDRSRELLRERP